MQLLTEFQDVNISELVEWQLSNGEEELPLSKQLDELFLITSTLAIQNDCIGNKMHRMDMKSEKIVFLVCRL